MFLAGLTSVADWIGSDVEFFPAIGNRALLEGPFDIDQYFSRAECNATVALEKLGWLGRTEQKRPIAITDFLPQGCDPRPLQTAVAEAVAEAAEPSLLIVEAPMGEGKTEAAWYAAACWDQRSGQGTYVALSTMATSNQMFDRVGRFLKVANGGNLMMRT